MFPVPPLAVDKVPAPALFIFNSPENFVALNSPVFELKVKFVPDFGGRLPVAAVVNKGKHAVSEDSSATVISDAAPLAVTENVVVPKVVVEDSVPIPIKALLCA